MNTVIIGLGNTFRGDDAVGVAVAERCRNELNGSTEVHTAISDASTLLDLWTDADLCFVVDCAVSGKSSGTVTRFDSIDKSQFKVKTSTFSTHALSLGQGLKLGRILNRLPRRLIIYAVEGERFACGAEMSPAVSAAVGQVARSISDEINALL